MGIRYYAYAFDNNEIDRALADPRSVLSSDPLADAWGLEPGAAVSATNFEQTPPRRDMLYLDKAWSDLQNLTWPDSFEGPPRPAFRMFEGGVSYCPEYCCWESWVRAVLPNEVVAIAEDLESISADEARRSVDPRYSGDERVAMEKYVTDYLGAARQFVQGLVTDRRGFVYAIG